MIIVHTAGGRTGNQVILLCNLLATAMKNNLSFISVCFRSVNQFDIETPCSVKCFYSRLSVWILWRLTFFTFLHPLLKLFKKSEPERISKLLAYEDNKNIIILNAWPYTDYSALYQFQHEVRKCIKPQRAYLNKANKFISSIRKESQIIVGVHIRRDDYKNWNNGAYYYSFETYKAFMRQIVEMCSKNVHFVICSDEQLSDAIFVDKIEQFSISGNDFMTDLAILSQCDYIIGPPSTFASYASFYGNTPRYTIYNESDEISSFDEFGVALIDYDDTYESYVNGEREARLHIVIKNGEICKIDKKR